MAGPRPPFAEVPASPRPGARAEGEGLERTCGEDRRFSMRFSVDRYRVTRGTQVAAPPPHTPVDALDRQALRGFCDALGVMSTADIVPRTRVRLGREVRSVRVVPRAGAPALELTIRDGRANATAGFLGRRKIAALHRFESSRSRASPVGMPTASRLQPHLHADPLRSCSGQVQVRSRDRAVTLAFVRRSLIWPRD